MQAQLCEKQNFTLEHLKVLSLANLGPLHQRTFHSFENLAENFSCGDPLMLVEAPFKDELSARIGVSSLITFLTYGSWNNLLRLNKAIFKRNPDVHIVNSMNCKNYHINQCNFSCLRICI